MVDAGITRISWSLQPDDNHIGVAIVPATKMPTILAMETLLP